MRPQSQSGRTNTPGRAAVTATLLLAVAAAGNPAAVGSAPASSPFELISQTPAGIGGDHRSALASVSDGGRFVGFTSLARDLVDQDTHDEYQTYIRDRHAGTTELLSRTPSGAAGNDASHPPELSATGRYVVFTSYASDLVPGDTGGFQDVFRVDRRTGQMSMISRGISDVPSDASSYYPGISDDGRYVVFMSAATNLSTEQTFEGTDPYDVFVHDVTTGTTTLLTRGLGGGAADSRSTHTQISGDGRFVVFDSLASNLVADDTNGKSDVFRLDRSTGAVQVISRDLSGATANGTSEVPALSSDGRLVTYQSTAPGLVEQPPGALQRDIYLHDAASATTTLVSRKRNGKRAVGSSVDPAISPNGKYVVFTSVANVLPRSVPDLAQLNAYRHHVRTGRNTFISPPVVGGEPYQGFVAQISSSGFAVLDSQGDLAGIVTPSYNDVYGRQTRRNR